MVMANFDDPIWKFEQDARSTKPRCTRIARQSDDAQPGDGDPIVISVETVNMKISRVIVDPRSLVDIMFF